MKLPFGTNGYPSNETLDAIEKWDYRDWAGLIEYLKEAWNHHHGVIREKKWLIEFVTGGWSGNEELLSGLRANFMIHATNWESSHRGGLVIYRQP